MLRISEEKSHREVDTTAPLEAVHGVAISLLSPEVCSEKCMGDLLMMDTSALGIRPHT